jgi:hypothetical protein
MGLLLLPLLALLLALLLWLVLLVRSLRASSSLPSRASSSRLLRGPMSPFSSRMERFCMRGRIMSQTRSSTRSWSTNSSMKVI